MKENQINKEEQHQIKILFGEQYNVIRNRRCVCREYEILKNWSEFSYLTKGKNLRSRNIVRFMESFSRQNDVNNRRRFELQYKQPEQNRPGPGFIALHVICDVSRLIVDQTNIWGYI